MSEPFYPINSFFGTQYAPLRFEADVHDCEIIGELPRELDGTLYRAGPDTHYPTMQGDIVINGDGIVSAFDLRDGRASFKCRYVRTERWQREAAAHRRLYGKYRNRFTDAPEVAGTDRDNTANTTAWFHAGKLFALREDSLPHQIDLDTLATLPTWNFQGALKSKSLTAHPKLDPLTGEWWSFSAFAQGTLAPDMAMQVIDRDGRLIREESFRAPLAGIAHDIAISREHMVFMIMPATVDAARVAVGGDFYAYDPAEAAAFGIMRRDASVETIRWFRLPACFCGHVMNAYNDGHVVHVDTAVSPGCSYPFFLQVDGRPIDVESGISTITRLSFDLASATDQVVRRPFAGAIGELPQMDPRYRMSAYRYGYIMSQSGLGRLDWTTGEYQLHPTPGGMAQEPIFVPRRPDSPEGDGFVLSVVSNDPEGIAELYVLDAMNWTGQPLARVRLPFRQPLAFHGSYVPRHARR